MNRVADNSLARMLLGWEPKVSFVEGLHRTTDWYFGVKDRELVASSLTTRLTER
jgi:nucleoside-diphosphate-sugar epimerase